MIIVQKKFFKGIGFNSFEKLNEIAWLKTKQLLLKELKLQF